MALHPSVQSPGSAALLSCRPQLAFRAGICAHKRRRSRHPVAAEGQDGDNSRSPQVWISSVVSLPALRRTHPNAAALQATSWCSDCCQRPPDQLDSEWGIAPSPIALRAFGSSSAPNLTAVKGKDLPAAGAHARGRCAAWRALLGAVRLQRWVYFQGLFAATAATRTATRLGSPL